MTALPHIICHASDFGAVTACGRCAQSWPTDAKDRPPCKPKADPPILIAEMIEAQRDEGQRILGSQRAIALAGMSSGPDMRTLRKASVFFATADLLERVRDNPRVVELLKGSG